MTDPSFHRDCDYTDCTKPAEWSVAVLLFPTGFVGMPARRVYPHRLCTEHAQAVQVRDLVDDTEWQSIVDNFTARGHAVPLRERCQVSYKKVREPLKVVNNGPA